MVPVVRPLLAAVALLALTACGGGDTDTDSDTINWGDYAPGLQDRIDEQADAQDCAGLQDEFDTAEGNGSVDLRTYIDQQLQAAGCYE